MGKNLKIVAITWIDSHAYHGWQSLLEINEINEMCYTIGFLVKETSKSTTVASSYDPENNNFNGVISIPREAIKSKRLVKHNF